MPTAKALDDLILPNACIGLGIAMVDSTMMPTLAYLVDIRHSSVYGSVYALGDIAFCASFVCGRLRDYFAAHNPTSHPGPLLSAFVGQVVGFECLIVATGLLCLCFSPALSLLNSPTSTIGCNELVSVTFEDDTTNHIFQHFIHETTAVSYKKYGTQTGDSDD